MACLLTCAGCGGPASDATDPSADAPPPKSLRERAERRAFHGAPPVIPHPPLSGTCVSCHTPTGRNVPTLGAAPANPHTRTAGLSAMARCRQCHAFRQSPDEFRESTFVALRGDGVRGERAHALAPPAVPHPRWMREDCAACHAGPAARPEIRCRHAERTRCVQCHVAQHAEHSASFDDSRVSAMAYNP